MKTEAPPVLEIICYKWGGKYPAEDVNILRSMVVSLELDVAIMLSEAIDSGRPTYGVCPRQVKVGREGCQGRYLAKIEQREFLRDESCQEVKKCERFLPCLSEAGWKQAGIALQRLVMRKPANICS